MKTFFRFFIFIFIIISSAGAEAQVTINLWEEGTMPYQKENNVKESTLYAEKLYDLSIPVEMHLFPYGGHGFGMGRSEDGTDQWVQLFVNWVKTNDFNE